MTVTVVTASGSYRVVLAGEARRSGALVLAPLVDPWTRVAPTDVTARARTPRTHAHVTGGHLVVTGASAEWRARLETGPVELEVDLLRPRRRPQTVTLTVPAASTLPFRLGAVDVAAATVLLSGRVTAAAFPHAPVPDAAVEVAGVGDALVTLSCPLALAHPAATDVRVRALTPGTARTLDGPVRAGDTAVRLSSTAGVGPGTLLAIGEDVVVVEATTGRLALLRTPLAASATDGAGVRLQTLGATGTTVALARDALAGDGLLPATGVLAGPVVEVVDGSATEYRRTVLTTDADGRWRLPGVRGVPEVEVTTNAAGFVTDGPRRVPLAPVDPFTVNASLGT